MKDYYNIHNLLSLVIIDAPKEFGIKSTLSHFKTSEVSEADIIFTYQTPSKPNFSNPTHGPKNSRFERHGNDVVLWIPDKAVIRHQGENSIHITSKNTDWIFLFMQTKLLEAGATLIHASGVGTPNGAVTFPAKGGVGKTLIAGYLLNNEHNLFLGDDFLIAHQNGSVYSFPRPLALYAYHQQIFPQAFSKPQHAKQKTQAKIHKTLRSVARKIVPKSMRKIFYPFVKKGVQRVKPTDLFGSDRIIDKSNIYKTIFITRGDAKEMEVARGANASSVAHRAVALTYHELAVADMLDYVLLLASFDIIGLEDLFSRSRQILNSHVEHSQNVYEVTIPQEMSINELGPRIDQIIS